MNFDLLINNLTNPALLFFFLGLLSVQLKSDLEIPENSSKFISLYLLFSIGFNGGQELSHSPFDAELLWSLLFGVALALVVPVYAFFILKKRMGVPNAGAIAAAYGSISAVTFVTAVSFLEIQEISFSGYMVAVMALMEAPSIIIGVLLMDMFKYAFWPHSQAFSHQWKRGNHFGQPDYWSPGNQIPGRRHKTIHDRYFQGLSRGIPS